MPETEPKSHPSTRESIDKLTTAVNENTESHPPTKESIDELIIAVNENTDSHPPTKESLEELVHAVDENTNVLRRVKRRYRLAISLVLAIALVFGLSVKFNYDGAVGRCEAANELRTEIDEKFQSVADSIISINEGPISPETQLVIDVLSSDLEPRDCSTVDWLGR